MRPQIVLLIPLGDAPANTPGLHPDNSLPWAPARPGHDLPGAPGRPDAGLPIAPGRPDHDLPTPPVDPAWGVRPPVDPGYGRPDISVGRPDNTLPLPPNSPVPPGSVYPPLTELRTKTATLAWLPGYGYRWVVLGPPPPKPGQPLPPTAQPKA